MLPRSLSTVAALLYVVLAAVGLGRAALTGSSLLSEGGSAGQLTASASSAATSWQSAAAAADNQAAAAKSTGAPPPWCLPQAPGQVLVARQQVLPTALPGGATTIAMASGAPTSVWRYGASGGPRAP